MNTKQRKRQRDIKTKLMAAICMLLVSSIMMVSTTYAWFTLSTAPEVTGINTAVGANGALEMALLPADGIIENITSDVGDSMTVKDKVAANITWGNLVDLSTPADQNKNPYGLDKIQLMPSRLHLADKTGDGKVNVMGAYLETPVYGYDGRVRELDDNATASAYKDFEFLASNSDYGVRALGVASSLSAREQGYRSFKSSANAARLSAQNKAGESLRVNGQVLASMAVSHAAGDDIFEQSDVDALQNVITVMTEVVASVETALHDYILMAVSSEAGQGATIRGTTITGITLAEYELLMPLWEKMTLDQLMADKMTLPTGTGGAGVEQDNPLKPIINMLTPVTQAKAKLAQMKTDMAAAQNGVTGLASKEDADTSANGKQYTWNDLSPILRYMVNPSTMVVNDYTIAQIQANNNLLINSYTSTGKLEIYLYDGSGVYSDVARICGNYDTPISLHISFSGLNTDVTAHMYAVSGTKADGDDDTPYITKLTTLIENDTDKGGLGGAPAAETGAKALLTDFYGYIIDLAFRTNAANATLQLQTEAIDRIYSDHKDQSSDTWGGGSYMTFKGASGFTNDQVKNLMDCINVVFFNKDDGSIYGIAKLDTENTVENTSGVTARLFMMEYTINETTGELTFSDVLGKNPTYIDGTPLWVSTGEGDEATTEGAKVSVHAPDYITVNGDYHVTADADYTFTVTGLKERTEYKVEYTIGDETTVLDWDCKKGDTAPSFTIPMITDGSTAVTINIVAVEKKEVLLTGDAFNEIDGTISESNLTEGNVDVDVMGPVGVVINGNSQTVMYDTNPGGPEKAGADYVLTMSNTDSNSTYTVTYKVGTGEDAEEKTLTSAVDADNKPTYVYTIPKAEILDNVVITVKENRPFEAIGDIVALTQNVGKAVSALVYLDGDSITNAHVANAAESMTGSMNLQFSTDATLVPMEYTPLMGEKVTYNVDKTTNVPAGVTVNGPSSASGEEDYTFTITGTGTYTVTATVGGQAVTVNTSGTTYSIAAKDIKGDVVITVTAGT